MVVPRGTRPRLTISPRARARLLAGFLAANLVLVLLSALDRLGWGWLVPGDWLGYLHATTEWSPADRYSGLLFGAVAVLAAVQALRPPPIHGGSRWLWTFGWLSLAVFVGLVAFDELTRGVRTIPVLAPALGRSGLSPPVPWVLVAVPLAAPLAAGGWVLVASQRGHPARALVTVVAVALALIGLILDANTDLLLYSGLVKWAGFPAAASGALYEVPEEGSEIMAAAALAVVLVETVVARPRAPPVDPGSRRRRWAALAVAAVLLAAGAFVLVTPHAIEDTPWAKTRPWSYTGPVSLIEQPFRASQDHLTRIKVWAYVDGDPGVAEVFARLTPTAESSAGPVRESRAEVRGAAYSNATVTFHFDPIPDSGGTRYTLAVGVLSGPTPYVFLGLTNGDVIAEGAAVVSGAPTRYADDLAMRTYRGAGFVAWARSHGPHRLALVVELTLTLFLMVFPIVAAWGGLSGRRPRFWRDVIWSAAWPSALIVAGFLIISLLLLTVVPATRLS